MLKNEEAPVDNWPKEIIGGDYTINIYQPHNESYSVEKKTNWYLVLLFSIKKNSDDSDLIFGSMWDQFGIRCRSWKPEWQV